MASRRGGSDSWRAGRPTREPSSRAIAGRWLHCPECRKRLFLDRTACRQAAKTDWPSEKGIQVYRCPAQNGWHYGHARGHERSEKDTEITDWIRPDCSLGSCVEVQLFPGMVKVRSSLTPQVEVVFTGDEWAVFLGAVKAGQFDTTRLETA